MKLYECSISERVIIKRVNCGKELKKRLEKLGVFEGVVLTLRRRAALGGPIEINVRGFNLALRKSDSEKIDVEKYE